MESKAGFLASVYGEKRDGFFMSEYTDNPYGKCKISRDKDGIAVSYPRQDSTNGEKRVDYGYCASLILHMIEENEYLTEGIFERFKEAPEAFAAMPWFMEIYHEYKERMMQEPDFEAISIDGQEEESLKGQEEEEQESEIAAEEMPETWQAVENAEEELPEEWRTAESGQEETAETRQKPETIGRVEGEVLNPNGSVADSASVSRFPEALRQVEAMDEDLREALEMLVTDCSVYSPFRAFLKDLAETRHLFNQDRLDFLSGVVLDGAGERKAYFNNQCGLIEYTLKPQEVVADYKNRNGERVKGTADYKELYEILRYMAQDRYYCGIDQWQYYDMQMMGDRENLPPLYRTFLEKQEQFLAEREHQKQLQIGQEKQEPSRNDPAEQGKQEYQEQLQIGQENREQLSIAHGSGADIASGGEQAAQEARAKAQNFHLEEDDFPKGGPKTRYQWNVEAVRLLKQIEHEGRTATPEEQKTLSRYVGWGGIAQAFD